MRFLATVAAIVVSSSMAMAAEVAGIKLDDGIALGGQNLILNGAGTRTKLFFKVYVAGLYLPMKQSSAPAVLDQKGPRRIQMVLTRDLESAQLLDGLNAGLVANNSAADLDAIKPQIDQLRSIFGTLKEAKQGTVIMLDYLPDTGTVVTLNGDMKGAIPGAAFNRALLKVWLGDDPVDESLKRAMLGG